MSEPINELTPEELVDQVAAAQRVYLFAEFTEAMTRLGRKYGIIAVQEQARAWADYIDSVRERNHL